MRFTNSKFAILSTFITSALASPFLPARDGFSRCETEPSESFRALSAEMRASDFSPNSTYGPGYGQTQIRVSTVFHVVSSGESEAEGNISDEVLQKQLEVINDNYAPHGIGFDLIATTRTANPDWAVAFSNTAMKSELHQGDYATLNVYFVQERPYLGICQFPEDPTEDVIAQDGCVVVASTVPGGVAPFDEGKTATHEIGHWFGLFHTFQDLSCEDGGDEIADTPQQSYPSSGCPIGIDTCPGQEGFDPIHNYMDYSDDACYEEFTPQQANRMYAMWEQFRVSAAERRL